MEALSSRIRSLEDAVAHSNGAISDDNKLIAAINDVSACRTSLIERITGLENRCVALEGSAASIGGPLSSSPSVDGLISRTKNFELSQRDYELIIFGFPISRSANRLDLLSSLASCLGISLLPNDIANLVRIGGSSASSSPLVVRFVSMSKRNEWLAAACRKRGITARDVHDFWLP